MPTEPLTFAAVVATAPTARGTTGGTVVAVPETVEAAVVATWEAVLDTPTATLDTVDAAVVATWEAGLDTPTATVDTVDAAVVATWEAGLDTPAATVDTVEATPVPAPLAVLDSVVLTPPTPSPSPPVTDALVLVGAAAGVPAVAVWVDALAPGVELGVLTAPGEVLGVPGWAWVPVADPPVAFAESPA